MIPNISATTKNEPAGINKPLHNAIPAIIRSIDTLSGVLEWYDKDRDFTIFATPNFINDGEVPFDIDRGSGLEIWNVCTIKMVDEDESTQFTHYLNVLMMIMNHYSQFTKPTENV